MVQKQIVALGDLQWPSGIRSKDLVCHAIEIGVAIALENKMMHG